MTLHAWRFDWRYLAFALLIFLLEILVATSLASVRFIRGSISDFLVVILLYFLCAAFYRCQPKALAAGIFLFAAAVEFSQYFHLADLLGFARGSLISILLGNTFSWQDMLMYALGSLAAYAWHGYVMPVSKAG